MHPVMRETGARQVAVHKRLRELGVPLPQSRLPAGKPKAARPKVALPKEGGKSGRGPIHTAGAQDTKDSPVSLATKDRPTLVRYIAQAFYDMPTGLIVDLFSSERRETLQDVVSMGTQLWLETTYKQQVLRVDWSIFTEEQFELLRALAAFINDHGASRAIIHKLRHAEWMRAAFMPLFNDVANDMYNMHFRRDVQLSWTPEGERAWEEQEEKRRKTTLGNPLVPVLQSGDPGYDEADDDSSSASEGDTMVLDIIMPTNAAFGA